MHRTSKVFCIHCTPADMHLGGPHEVASCEHYVVYLWVEILSPCIPFQPFAFWKVDHLL